MSFVSVVARHRVMTDPGACGRPHPSRRRDRTAFGWLRAREVSPLARAAGSSLHVPSSTDARRRRPPAGVVHSYLAGAGDRPSGATALEGCDGSGSCWRHYYLLPPRTRTGTGSSGRCTHVRRSCVPSMRRRRTGTAAIEGSTLRAAQGSRCWQRDRARWCSQVSSQVGLWCLSHIPVGCGPATSRCSRRCGWDSSCRPVW